MNKTEYAKRACMKLNEIILEKYLSGVLPKTRQILLEEVNRYCATYNFNCLREYDGGNYFRILANTIIVIADNEFLHRQAKLYCKRLIIKLLMPPQLDDDSYDYRLERYINDMGFTADEIAFINLVVNEIMSTASIKECPHQVSEGDLIKFNWLNAFEFCDNAKSIYKRILQKKLHAGDNIMCSIQHRLENFQFAQLLNNAAKYDYFFDKYGFLKCDLETNKNVLIKNFINTVLYDFDDPISRAELLQKLNTKHPILISK